MSAIVFLYIISILVDSQRAFLLLLLFHSKYKVYTGVPKVHSISYTVYNDTHTQVRKGVNIRLKGGKKNCTKTSKK